MGRYWTKKTPHHAGEDRDGVYGKEKGMTYYWYYHTAIIVDYCNS